MKTKIRVESQVESFVKSLAPVPRRRLRLAIRGLEYGRGDIKSLEGNLAGYSRLSVTGYRVIFNVAIRMRCLPPPGPPAKGYSALPRAQGNLVSSRLRRSPGPVAQAGEDAAS